MQTKKYPLNLMFLAGIVGMTLSLKAVTQTVDIRSDSQLNSRLATFNTTPLYSGKTAATWLWDVRSILSNGTRITTTDKSRIDALIKFCQQKQITEIFLQINRDISIVKYQFLIASLSAAQVKIGSNVFAVKVQALDGASNWVTAEGDLRKNAFFEWVFAYQKSASATQRFTAIHLDVEPYTGELWRSNLAAGILAFQDFVIDAKTRIANKNLSDQLNLGMVVDIPFWYDERLFSNRFGTGNLAEWVYQTVPAVAIMAYRDTATGPNSGIVNIASTELRYGQLYGKPTYIGVETSLQDLSYVSFYEEGEAKMRQVLNSCVTSFASNSATASASYSFAIHDFANWKALPLSPR